MLSKLGNELHGTSTPILDRGETDSLKISDHPLYHFDRREVDGNRKTLASATGNAKAVVRPEASAFGSQGNADSPGQW